METFNSLGIPQKWKELALETGCLDTGKLNVFKTGKFEEWDDFEVALEAGFKKFSEWNDAKQKNCTKYDDYLVVSSYGWNSFDELEHAKSLNIRLRNLNITTNCTSRENWKKHLLRH